MLGNHLLQRQSDPKWLAFPFAELPVGQRDKARQAVRHFDPGKPLNSRFRVFDCHGKIQAEIGHLGERMRRIDTQRRQHRKHIFFKMILHHLALPGIQIGIIEKENAPRNQRRP